jgi:hypothetical protein
MCIRASVAGESGISRFFPVAPAGLVVSGLNLAPAVGFEPTTNRLTADRSTTELRWITQLKNCERVFSRTIAWRQLTIESIPKVPTKGIVDFFARFL